MIESSTMKCFLSRAEGLRVSCTERRVADRTKVIRAVERLVSTTATVDTGDALSIRRAQTSSQVYRAADERQIPARALATELTLVAEAKLGKESV
jgi:hypothetical protein